MKLASFAAFGFTLALCCSIVDAQPPEQRPVRPAQPTIPVAPPTVENQVASVIYNFVIALHNSDMEVASQFVVGGQTGAALKIAGDELLKARGTWKLNCSRIDVLVNNDMATAKIRVRLQDHLRNKLTHDERLTLRLEEGNWKIVPLSQEALRQSIKDDFDSNLIENFATYLAQPQFTAEIRARQCLDKLKWLALGAMQFLQDWDQRFAFKADNFKQSIMPYILDEDVFHCPADKGDALSYSFNPDLEGVAQARINDRSLTVLFYEGKNRQLVFRHDNRAAVAFADGHVEIVTPERAKTLKWLP